MSKYRPYIGVFIAFLFAAMCFSSQAQTLLCLPRAQKLVVGQSSQIYLNLPEQIIDKIEMKIIRPSYSVFAVNQDSPIIINKSGAGYEITALKPGKADITFKILGYIPIKSMSIETLPTRRVVPGGHSIGVMLQSKGIMVVGFAPVLDSNGSKRYPAKEQGVELGDLIININGQAVTGEEELAQIIDGQQDNPLEVEVKRNDKTFSIKVQGAYCAETNRYRIGLFVRDGIVGVGTLSFWDPATREFAALGHIILDNDTQQGIEVGNGKIVSAAIQNIKSGTPGQPGEKIGIFNDKSLLQGNINKNTYYGVFGESAGEIANPISALLEVAYAHQINEGPAEIYTVVNGEQIEKFAVEIEKLHPDTNNNKNMVIHITDERLISLTGGIIQGMSGSPIIQDNRIVGAVTHVFLNDPRRGYGIYMDNMLGEMASPANENNEITANFGSFLRRAT